MKDPELDMIYRKRVLGITGEDKVHSEVEAGIKEVTRIAQKMEGVVDFIISKTGTIPYPRGDF